MTRVRKPGEYFQLTDDELLLAPPKLLSPEQRKRRRMLKRRTTAREKSERRLENQGKPQVLKCMGYRSDGEACGSYAVKGAKHCFGHLNSAEKAALGYDKKRKPGYKLGKPKVESVPRLMMLATERAAEVMLQRYFRAVGLVFVGIDEEGNPIIEDEGIEQGLMLHGESKEGYVHMSQYPDLVGQIHIIEKLMDRVYGRPRQTTVLEGGSKPIQVQPVRTVERSRQLGDLLHRVGAIPHEGRTRREPSEPEDNVENVVPLRGEADANDE